MSLASVYSLVAGTGSTADGTIRIEGELDGDHLLVPLLTPEVPVVSDQLRVAAALARTTGASVHVVNPLAVSETGSREPTEVTVDDGQALAEWTVDQVSTPQVGPRFDTGKLVRGLLGTVRTNDIDTLVVPSGSEAGRLRRGLTERLALHAACDVITVNGRHGFEEVPSILLAVADGPHSGLAADVARQIADDCDAWIDVLHVIDENPSDRQRDRAEAFVEATSRRIARPEATATWVLEAEDVAEAIITQSVYYGLAVIGAPTKSRLREFIFGSTNRTIRNNARSVVLSARRHGADGS